MAIWGLNTKMAIWGINTKMTIVGFEKMNYNKIWRWRKPNKR